MNRDVIRMTYGREGEGRLFIEDYASYVKAIVIQKSEFVDFDGLDMCQYKDLVLINLVGTPNNFEKQNYPCYFKQGNLEIYVKVGNERTSFRY